MDTMNLNDPSDGMVPLDIPTPQKPSEKNISTKQMDSTPISDVMTSSPLEPDGMMYAQSMNQPMMQQQQPQQQPQQQHPQMGSKNPFNMTDDQYQALVAGVCAIVAFCKPVQEKLLGTFPQLAVDGIATTYGLIVSGLLAAVLYYLAQRFVINPASP